MSLFGGMAFPPPPSPAVPYICRQDRLSVRRDKANAKESGDHEAYPCLPWLREVVEGAAPRAKVCCKLSRTEELKLAPVNSL